MTDQLLPHHLRCSCWTPDESNPAEFEAFTTFAPRIGDKTRWCVNLRVRCAKCKREYRFDGLLGGHLGGMVPATPGHMGYGACLPISRLENSQNRIIQQVDPWEGEERVS